DAPAPASSSTSTSFADMLAAGRGTTDAAKAAPAHPAMQSAPQATVQVYTRFVERFDGRAQRFEVSLTPEELGRVDVRIEVGADKKVHAVLAAHDSAALTDLMRGQRALERALADAGIDLKDGGIKFELANDSGRSLAGQEQRRDAWTGEDTNVWRGFSNVDVAIETDAPIAAASYRRASRLDLVA
ncbi:MAG TPA: flagellar hook-length control protein FliK, partial [Hyphomonadaceae bacterium]|nr:flagellar hook-length control protein FliK [Hyphomonadaceae bacterium]